MDAVNYGVKFVDPIQMVEKRGFGVAVLKIMSELNPVRFEET